MTYCQYGKLHSNNMDLSNDINELVIEFLYQRNKVKLDSVLETMAYYHLMLGTDAYFYGRDIGYLKQHYHVAALLDSLGSTSGSDESTTLSNPNYLYAMLSDSNLAVLSCAEMASHYFKENCELPNTYQFYSHMYQLAVLKNYDELKEKLSLATSTVKKSQERRIYHIEFYQLLLNSDRVGLEKLILKLAVGWKIAIDQGRETGSVITANVIAPRAMEFAKLCWLQGIEVEIDHPLIPMELLPIWPLAHYDDVYDFLSPDWVPPPQGRMADFKRWLKAKF